MTKDERERLIRALLQVARLEELVDVVRDSDMSIPEVQPMATNVSAYRYDLALAGVMPNLDALADTLPSPVFERARELIAIAVAESNMRLTDPIQ
jgi:hypothetical protein